MMVWLRFLLGKALSLPLVRALFNALGKLHSIGVHAGAALSRRPRFPASEGSLFRGAPALAPLLCTAALFVLLLQLASFTEEPFPSLLALGAPALRRFPAPCPHREKSAPIFPGEPHHPWDIPAPLESPNVPNSPTSPERAAPAAPPSSGLRRSFGLTLHFEAGEAEPRFLELEATLRFGKMPRPVSRRSLLPGEKLGRPLRLLARTGRSWPWGGADPREPLRIDEEQFAATPWASSREGKRIIVVALPLASGLRLLFFSREPALLSPASWDALWASLRYHSNPLGRFTPKL